jgi:hypothetical protein
MAMVMRFLRDMVLDMVFPLDRSEVASEIGAEKLVRNAP